MKSTLLLVLSLVTSFGLVVAEDAQAPAAAPASPPAVTIHSARSGPWSDPATWEGGKLPAAGEQARIREGHTVIYDVNAPAALRSVFVNGTLTFATDKDTCLNTGLLRIQSGDITTDHGFDCDAKLTVPDPNKPRAALEVGSQLQPVEAGHRALIRLTLLEGQDPKSCPAIVCCGGRMDFHGAPLDRTWLKLGAPAKTGDASVTLTDAVSGWRVGDHIIVTATLRQNKIKKTFKPSVRDSSQTEERTVAGVEGAVIKLDKPLEFDHICDGDYRGDVANLSRNVIVESSDPEKARGHTMYHRNSAGSISYAEFRHLGKEGVLGRYTLHFHLCAATMRGSSVIGASIWDSGNRWITIHGTNYLVVRDCVGFRSIGHGYFLEDGTEQYNVLDRNLAVQACGGKPLPDQVLPFDHNDGAGFWWANNLNTFTRNVACECDEYGYRFDMVKTAKFDTTLNVQQPDGSMKDVDVRTLPFVRFDDNESHCQRRHAFNLGGFADKANFNEPMKEGVAGVGPDEKHPIVIRNLKCWNVHWAIHSLCPSVMIDGMNVQNAEYGLWRMNYTRNSYRNIKMTDTPKEDFTPAMGTRPDEKEYPKPIEAVDDLPPATVITQIDFAPPGKVFVRGTTSDNGTVKRVVVNGVNATSVGANFSQWEASLPKKPGALAISAFAEDAAGNAEKLPHAVSVTIPPETYSDAEREWTLALGCRHCHYSDQTGIQVCTANCGAAGAADGKVYYLTGAGVPKDFKKGGQWKINGRLSTDGKTINVSAMKMLAPEPPAQDAAAPSAAAQVPPGAVTWSGSVTKTGAGLPEIQTGAAKFALKAAKDADASVRTLLTRIGGGELNGEFTVTGKTYEDDARKWIVVESIRAAASKESGTQR